MQFTDKVETTLPKTNIDPEKNMAIPKGNDRIPRYSMFRGVTLAVSSPGRVTTMCVTNVLKE